MFGVGAAMLGSSALGLLGAGKAADAQKYGYDSSDARFRAGQKMTAPWRKSGEKAMTQYEKLMGLGEAGDQQDAYAAFRNTPGYKFQQDEMRRSLEGSSAATGQVGGQLMKDLMKYGGNLADQNFGTYMDRLSGMSTMGANAATNSASQYAQHAQNAIGAGQAQAGQFINQANVMSNALGQGVQAYGMGMFGSKPQSTGIASQAPSVGASVSNQMYGNQNYGGYQMPTPAMINY